SIRAPWPTCSQDRSVRAPWPGYSNMAGLGRRRFKHLIARRKLRSTDHHDLRHRGKLFALLVISTETDIVYAAGFQAAIGTHEPLHRLNVLSHAASRTPAIVGYSGPRTIAPGQLPIEN